MEDNVQTHILSADANADDALVLKNAYAVSEESNWYKDNYNSVASQRNILLVAFAVVIFCLFGTVYAVNTLNESKIFEPFILKFHDKNMELVRIDANSLDKYRTDEKVIKSFLYRYVNFRESYSLSNYLYNYTVIVKSFSTDEAYENFRWYIARRNPDSPVNLEERSDKFVTVKSISFIGENKAHVRVQTKVINNLNNGVSNVEDKIITIEYRFDDLEQGRQTAFINPLGFVVVSYNSAEDVK